MSSLVYIILPVYNGEKYLLQQLMSIYFQDYENWHLIIINDWSTDSTKSIIDKFISDYKLQKKITIISQKNQWLNKSIENWLIEAKKIIELWWNNNAYITYCDADDLMMTNRLSYQVNFMEKHKECDLSYHDLILIDENNNVTNLSYLKNVIHGILNNTKCDEFYEFCWANHIPSTTIMFKSDKIDLLFPFPNKFPFQDRWTALVFSWNNLNIKNIWIALWYYRKYSNQMSDLSWKKIDLSKRFMDFVEALLVLKKSINNISIERQIDDYIDYFKDKAECIKFKKSNFIQKIEIIFKHPRIILYRLLSCLHK